MFSYDNALRWIPRDFIDDKSTLVLVMTWINVDSDERRWATIS